MSEASELTDDLDWTAFRYIAGEMTDEEQAAFELRLAEDQEAREAVARSVALADVTCRAASLNSVPDKLVPDGSVPVRPMPVRPASPVASVGQDAPWRVGRFVGGALALAALFAFILPSMMRSSWNGWLTGLAAVPSTGSESAAASGSDRQAGTVFPGTVFPGTVTPELALAWVEERSSSFLDPLPDADSRDAADGTDVHVPWMREEVTREEKHESSWEDLAAGELGGELSAPSWMLVAVAELEREL